MRGLGEAVVCGTANPEELIVEVSWQPVVLDRRSNSDQGEVLSDDLAIRLAYLVQRVYWALGDGQEPQDIEWAYDGSSFWLLQAGPVTRLPRYTSPGADRLPVVWFQRQLERCPPRRLIASRLEHVLVGDPVQPLRPPSSRRVRDPTGPRGLPALLGPGVLRPHLPVLGVLRRPGFDRGRVQPEPRRPPAGASGR